MRQGEKERADEVKGDGISKTKLETNKRGK